MYEKSDSYISLSVLLVVEVKEINKSTSVPLETAVPFADEPDIFTSTKNLWLYVNHSG